MLRPIILTASLGLSILAISLFFWLWNGPSDSADIYQPRPAGTLTFNKDIAPIVLENCTTCHRPGESAPFSLLSYQDVKKRAEQIVDVTESRFMPPWMPEPRSGKFVGERRLNRDQMGLIRQWAAEGAVEGDPADLPPVRHWNEGWQLGQPDLVITAPGPYTLPAEGKDVYRNFVVPIPISSTRYVRTVELRPGNKRIVHHANMFVDRTHMTRRLDEKDPGTGFEGMAVGYGEYPDGHFLGWAPGKTPDAGAPGVSWRLDPGTDFVIQLHMRPTGKPETIQPTVGFFFDDSPRTGPAAHLLAMKADKAIDIPAGVKDFEVSERFVLPVDAQVAVVYPHAHYLGKEIEAFARLPDGTTEWLISIKDWDFDWQDSYRYSTPLFIPKDSVLTMRWKFDNSADNPRNPNRPPQRVMRGNKTTDEMAHLYLQLLLRDQREVNILKIAKLRHQLQTNPRSWSALTDLGAALRSQGKPQEAMRNLRRALQIKPDYAPAHYHLALLLDSHGQLARASEHYRQAVRLWPEHPVLHSKLAVALSAQGLLNKAIEHVDRAVEIKPDFAEAYVNRANAYGRLGKWERSISDYSQAIGLKPEYAEAYNYRGVAYHQLGKYELALNDYTQAIALKADYPHAYNNRGNTHSTLRNYQMARRDYSQAISLKPDYILVYNNRANAARQMGDYRSALDDFERLKKLAPASAHAYDRVAWLLATCPDPKFRDGEKAVVDARQACDRTEWKNSGILDTLAAAYAEVGDFAQAVNWQTKALELAPKRAEAVLQSRLELYKAGRPFRDLRD